MTFPGVLDIFEMQKIGRIKGQLEDIPTGELVELVRDAEEKEKRGECHEEVNRNRACCSCYDFRGN